MTSFTDIFNSSFFVCLGMIVLFCALLFLYFESKMREQNHKFTSMLSLISSMAEELNYIKAYSMNTMAQNGGQPIVQKVPFTNNMNNINDYDNLIKVSDGEDTDNDSSQSESDSESDVESSDSDSESESESDSQKNKNIKHLKLTSTINQQNDSIVITENVDNIEILDMDGLEEEESCSEEDDMEDLDDSGDDSGDEEDEDTNDIPKLDLSNLEETDISENNMEELVFSSIVKEDPDPDQDQDQEPEVISEKITELKENDMEDLKKINIFHLEEVDGFLDYKKCSVSKLKSLVVEKGLVADATRLKKNELLKLLGVSE